MSLRPRYSLLTLLILTALVAGGVKLWYGPYHVVEQLEKLQMDYTYYNNWRRDAILIGPSVTRFSDENGSFYSVMATYYRNGDVLSNWLLLKHPPDTKVENKEVDAQELSKQPLYQKEQEEFLRTIITERTKLKELYPGCKISESFSTTIPTN